MNARKPKLIAGLAVTLTLGAALVGLRGLHADGAAPIEPTSAGETLPAFAPHMVPLVYHPTLEGPVAHPILVELGAPGEAGGVARVYQF